MHKHFGEWLRRLVDRSVSAQKDFAPALDMTLKALRDKFKQKKNALRGPRIEALLRITGIPDKTALYEMVDADKFPDEVTVLAGIKRCLEINKARQPLREIKTDDPVGALVQKNQKKPKNRAKAR